MADGPYAGRPFGQDDLLEGDIRETIADLRSQRRAATIDAAVGLVGCPAALVHAFAPWAELFKALRIGWLPHVVAACMLLWGAYNVLDAIRLRREERLLS